MAATAPFLKADPNPVPAGTGPGSTTLSWGTDEKGFNQVFVSVDGGPEKMVVQGAPGSQQIDWVYPGPVYEFRLYAGKSHAKLLASVTVTRAP